MEIVSITLERMRIQVRQLEVIELSSVVLVIPPLISKITRRRVQRVRAIRVRSTAVGAVTGTVNARVRNNTIGVAGTANSGSSESFGIFAFGDGGSDMNIAITNNQVFQYNNHGINVQFGDEINNGSVFNATVTGNTVSNPGNINTNFNGIQLNNGTVAATG